MRNFFIIIIFPLLTILSGCDSFLAVDNIDEMSGNVFWKTKDDVEGFALSMYSEFRDATMTDCALFPVSGDFRCAPVKDYYDSGSYNWVAYLANNDLSTLLDQYSDSKFQGVTKWNTFYEVISSANILLYEIDRMDAGALTDNEIAGYKAEAHFMRNLSYFFLVRLYGDVPYWTNAYNEDALPRTDMVTVLQNCLADMQSVLDDDPNAEALPWTYANTAKVAVRAMRGSAIALMMHINLWLAGFDVNNRDTYYQNVVNLGADITANGGYQLLDLSKTNMIFSGGSKESLFEIVQDINKDEDFEYNSVYSNYTVPENLNEKVQPTIYYTSDFLRAIFPSSKIDGRTDAWFKNIYASDESSDEIKWVTKFLNEHTDADGNFTSNMGNQIVFRYADVILMYAEAAAELDDDVTGRDLVNQIRNRAGAEEFTASGQDLKDDIYWERVRELIGEGYYYYDLVRTRKIYNGNYAYNAISRSAFDQGAWTWPINKDALDNNPKMSLNQYWN